MRRIYIAVQEEAFAALQRRALAERRDVRDQAAVELERLLAGPPGPPGGPGRSGPAGAAPTAPADCRRPLAPATEDAA